MVAEERLRDVVADADASKAFVAGRLVERQRERRRAARSAWRSKWKKVERTGRRAFR